MLDKKTEETQATAPRALKTIAVYGYHPDTLEPLRYAITADESPLEEDVYLLPQYTTRTEPLPNRDGYTQRYEQSSDTWQYLRTWRSVPLYHTGTGLQYYTDHEGWDGLGELPNTLTDLPPPSPAHDWDAEKQVWVENKKRAVALKEAEESRQTGLKIEAMRQGVQNWLDAEAQKAGFDNIEKAVLRAGYDGPLRKIGTAYAVWMDTVWLECKALLTRWQQGEVDLETFDDVKAHLTAPPSLT